MGFVFPIGGFFIQDCIYQGFQLDFLCSIFGKKMGDFEQDIVLSIIYKP